MEEDEDEGPRICAIEVLLDGIPRIGEQPTKTTGDRRTGSELYILHIGSREISRMKSENLVHELLAASFLKANHVRKATTKKRSKNFACRIKKGKEIGLDLCATINRFVTLDGIPRIGERWGKEDALRRRDGHGKGLGFGLQMPSKSIYTSLCKFYFALFIGS